MAERELVGKGSGNSAGMVVCGEDLNSTVNALVRPKDSLPHLVGELINN